MEKVSFVIPVYNEEESLQPLFDELKLVADALGSDYEILFIDDGSNDGSLAVIQLLAKRYPQVKYLSFETNTGQSAAFYAGFQHATGKIIITMDADLQNDPADIPKMLRHYGPYEMVTGWRHNRQDTRWRKLGGTVGNFVRNRLTFEEIHDTGCSLKIMKAEMARNIKMFRGLHRFLPTLMKLEGAQVLEVKVNHRARRHGTSKYTNLRRAVEGLYDVIAVRWMVQRHLDIRYRETHV
jgi:dolichol-phosphate mannosyltransferase